MKKMQAGVLIVAVFTLCASASASEIGRLDAPQRQALQRAFPDAKILSACMGNYSGNSPRELVLALASASGAADPAISRVGMTLSNHQWTVHRIDHEMMKDAAVSDHSHIEQWIDPSEQEPEKLALKVKCDVNLHADKTFSHNGKLLGRPLFFQAHAVPKGFAANACFPSDTHYNNWDCIAYDPKAGRFRLWYQQVFAD